MKICVAQTRPVKGDIPANIERHKNFIGMAVSNNADIIIFPELSLTGYVPTLAKELAADKNDSRFNDFQNISDNDHITIGVGLPIKSTEGICISMMLFQPQKERCVYLKKYLHPDEEKFFVGGQSLAGIQVDNVAIAFAICYELSIPEHSENAHKTGAEIYIASVAKSFSGVEKAVNSLSDIANKYSMKVLMSNSVGQCDDFECAGKTSVWNERGLLRAQLNDSDEGILIIDTETQELLEMTM